MDNNKQQNVKKSVVSNLIWNYAERLLAQGVSFIVTVVLARMLTPEHYGVIAIVTIFITICNVFITSGFGSALIQKKEADELDFNTVFWFSFGMAWTLYALMYFAAPFIADFYNVDELTPIIRVMSFRLPIAGINTVQHAFLARKMQFKKFFWSTLLGTVISAVVGIVLAMCGYGVWALVFQYLTNTSIDTIVLNFTCGWRPKFQYSFARMKTMFKFGLNVLLSSLFATLYEELRSFIIGKRYSKSDLALYNKGKQVPSIIVVNINASISKVLFPAISKYQDERTRIKQMARRSMTISAFLIFPILFGLIATAEPLILLLFTKKWEACIPYLQILSAMYLFLPIETANIQAINAIGKSNITMRLQTVKICCGIAILLATLFVFDSPIAIAVGTCIASFLGALINAFPNKKLFGYTYFEQFKDISPILFVAGTMCAITFAVEYLLVNYLGFGMLATLCIQIIIGISVYILLSKLLKIQAYTFTVDLIKSFKRKRSK